jgi:uncharacterized protein (UPF0264 family)
LVSVRSLEEARAAIAGGCDLLDLKEPNRGSLGAADLATIEEVCRFVGGIPDAPAVSVALGELSEWSQTSSESELPENVRYAKLGFAHASLTWPADWRNVRQKVATSTDAHVRWVAVHYADAPADSPPLGEMLSEAVAAGCRGLLIDTYGKHTGRLLDLIPVTGLIEVRQQTASAGLIMAVAGSLRESDLPQLVEVSPEIIAIRGAVCTNSDRTTAISEDLVREFRREIARVFRPEDAHISDRAL